MISEISAYRQLRTKLAYLKTTQIKGHSTDKHSHLEQGVQQYAASSIEGKVSHSRHGHKRTESEGYNLRYRAEQNRRSHLCQSSGDALFRRQIKGQRSGIERFRV